MDYLLHIAIMAVIFMVFAASLNLQLGVSGLYNFGQVAFFAIGAYASAILSTGGAPIGLSMLAAIVVAALAGLLISVPLLRMRGDYFGIASLAFAEMIRLLALNERWATGGPMGIPAIPRPEWLGMAPTSLVQFLVIAAALAALALAGLGVLQRAPFGRTLKLIREDENVAMAFARDVKAFKRRAMCVSAAAAGLAGALWAHYLTYISPNDFTVQTTILLLLCLVLGGKGTIAGPILGAGLVMVIQEALRFLPLAPELGRLVAPIQGIVFGAVLVLLMIRRPQGLIGEMRE